MRREFGLWAAETCFVWFVTVLAVSACFGVCVILGWGWFVLWTFRFA